MGLVAELHSTQHANNQYGKPNGNGKKAKPGRLETDEKKKVNSQAEHATCKMKRY